MPLESWFPNGNSISALSRIDYPRNGSTACLKNVREFSNFISIDIFIILLFASKQILFFHQFLEFLTPTIIFFKIKNIILLKSGRVSLFFFFSFPFLFTFFHARETIDKIIEWLFTIYISYIITRKISWIKYLVKVCRGTWRNFPDVYPSDT